MFPGTIGKITLFPYDFDPAGWTLCDGRQLPISENDALSQVLGTTFGGDGMETFALPDLRKAAPPNCRYCISLTGSFPTGRLEGALGETTLWASQIQPPDLMECAGQLLQKNQNMYLATLMGTRFGGDGTNNFKLADLRKNAPENLRYLIAVQGSDPNSVKGRNCFAGELTLVPFELQPGELLLCDGSKLTKTSNKALAALLGNRFGGDATQLALPDLRAAAPPKHNYYLANGGVFPPRS